MTTQKIKINRAPVLTLWAAIVSERMGYDHASALTLGKAVAGLNAQSKGKRLGIYPETKKDEADAKESKAKPKAGETIMIDVLGRPVPAVHTKDGMRATTKDEPINAESVEHYLKQKFGEDLPTVEKALTALADSLEPKQLASRAYALYEDFRPAVPEGEKGWGAKGELDLGHIHSLAKK